MTSPTRRARPAPKPAEEAEGPAHAYTDWTAVVPAISWIAPDYTPPEVVLNPEPPEEVVDPPGGPGSVPGQTAASAAALGHLKYVGFLRERERLVALMSVEYRQRFVREGDTLSDYTVAAVHPSHIVLRNGPTEHRLDITAPMPTSLMQKLAPVPPAMRVPPGRPEIRTGRDDIAERERRMREAAEQAGESPS